MRLRRIAAVAAVIALVVAACGTTTGPTATPAPTPTASPSAAPSAPTPTALPSAAPSAPPTTAPATPSPTPAGPVSLEGWTGGTIPPAIPDSGITDVVAGREQLVAVGISEVGLGGVWTSVDGVEWTPIVSDEMAGVALAGVTAVSDGYVAVGRELNRDREVAAVLQSADGQTWTRVATTPALVGGSMTDVADSPVGVIAVGNAAGADLAAVWIATDGTDWERVPDATTFENSFLWTVASVGPGLIAGGWREQGEPTAAIWTSTDGRAWSLAPSIQDAIGMQIRSIVATDDGYLAVGDGIEGTQAAMWTSPDGGTWTRIEDRSFLDASLVSITRTSAGYVAVGGRGADDAGVWTSADGASWEVVEEDALQQAYFFSLAPWAGRMVAVGITQVPLGDTSSYDVRAGAWATTP